LTKAWHAFVKHIVLFLYGAYICPYVVIAVFSSSCLPDSNFALDNTIYQNVKQL